jgi:predicted acyltransferase
MQGNLASYIDRLLLPGTFCCYEIGDNEGLLSTLPAICTALLGMFTGQFVMSQYLNNKPLRKVIFMVLASISFMIIGQVWNLAFPINKNLWSSSFVCFVGGLSLLLFSIFYLIIDVWHFKKWTLFFVVIGMNPITIYLTERIVNFRSANKFFFGGISDLLPETWAPLIEGIGITAIAWVFLYILYKKKIFLKI